MQPLIRTPDSSTPIAEGLHFPGAFTEACADTWKLCGEGVFSWSVFRFYKAALLTRTGLFELNEPFLLDLHYLRKLPGQQIVSTSLEEMARLSEFDAQRQHAWSEALLGIIPDVGLGDRLLGWFVPGAKVNFYSATRLLGQIEDPEFVRVFSAIWLDERTRSPQLRAALLGKSTFIATAAKPLQQVQQAGTPTGEKRV